MTELKKAGIKMVSGLMVLLIILVLIGIVKYGQLKSIHPAINPHSLEKTQTVLSHQT